MRPSVALPLAVIRAACAIVAIAAAFATFSVTNARASFFTFCSPSYLTGNTVPYDRCAHSVYRQYAYVRASAAVKTTYCAIVKGNPDGGGTNNTAPTCAYSDTYIYSYCGSPYSCQGYPTITNDGVATSYQYYGAANF